MRSNSIKVLFLFVTICAFVNVHGQGTGSRIDSVFFVAERYVNTFEATNRNDGEVFDYFRGFAGESVNKMTFGGKQLAHCGFAVYAIFYEAGYKLPVKEWGRAKSFADCKLVTNVGKAYAVGLDKIKPANIVVYQPLKGWFSSYHTGILKEKYATYATVYESNTSARSSVYKTQNRNDGFYLKIRPYWIMWKVVDCLCDATPSDPKKVQTLKNKYLKNFKPNRK